MSVGWKGVVLACLLCATASSARADGLILTTEDYPPFNFSRDGAVAGLSTDLLRHVLERAEVPGQFALYPWLRAYGAAQNDTDTCVYSTTRTPQREPLFKWVGPLVYNDWVLFAPPDSQAAPTALEDVRNAVIGGYQGDATAVYLRDQGFRVDDVTSDRLNPRKLLSGRIDYWATGRLSGEFLARQEGVTGLQAVLTFKHVPLYLACNKTVSDQTIGRLNDALRALTDEGVTDRIAKAYR